MPKIFRKRWFRVLSVLLLIVLVIAILHWPAPVKIIISHDTTRITGPVNSDGTINYVAAMNEEFGKGVTAENNAAIILLRAFGPEFLEAETRDKVLEILEIDPLPEDGDYFVSLDDYEEDHPASEQDAVVAVFATTTKHLDVNVAAKTAATAPASQPADDEEYLCMRLAKTIKQPWSAKEYPIIAAWLKVNEKPLLVVAAAVKRPRYYMPLVSQSDPPRVLDTLWPSFSTIKNVAKALAARAMLKFKAGDIEGAWADLMTARRLARLINQDPTLVGRLVGMSIEAIGCAGTNTMATSGKLSAGQAMAFLEDLKSLPPLSDVVEAIDREERFLMLDIVMMMYSGGDSAISATPGVLKGTLVRSAIDWNEVLRVFNHWHDRFVEAHRKPTFSARKKATAAVDTDIQKLMNKTRGAGAIARIIIYKIAGHPMRKRFSRMIANLLMSTLMPTFSRVSEIHSDVLMRMEISKLAMALVVYKAEKGNYPDKLEALAPALLKTIPQDVFIDKPLKYERREAGYLLYSVGPNTKDDGGSDDSDADHDDIPARAEK